MAKRRARRPAYRWLTPPERRAIEERLRAGAKVKEIVSEFGCSAVTVWRIRDRAHQLRRRVHTPSCAFASRNASRSAAASAPAIRRARSRTSWGARPRP